MQYFVLLWNGRELDEVCNWPHVRLALTLDLRCPDLAICFWEDLGHLTNWPGGPWQLGINDHYYCLTRGCQSHSITWSGSLEKANSASQSSSKLVCSHLTVSPLTATYNLLWLLVDSLGQCGVKLPHEEQVCGDGFWVCLICRNKIPSTSMRTVLRISSVSLNRSYLTLALHLWHSTQVPCCLLMASRPLRIQYLRRSWRAASLIQDAVTHCQCHELTWFQGEPGPGQWGEQWWALVEDTAGVFHLPGSVWCFCYIQGPEWAGGSWMTLVFSPLIAWALLENIALEPQKFLFLPRCGLLPKGYLQISRPMTGQCSCLNQFSETGWGWPGSGSALSWDVMYRAQKVGFFTSFGSSCTSVAGLIGQWSDNCRRKAGPQLHRLFVARSCRGKPHLRSSAWLLVDLQAWAPVHFLYFCYSCAYKYLIDAWFWLNPV